MCFNGHFWFAMYDTYWSETGPFEYPPTTSRTEAMCLTHLPIGLHASSLITDSPTVSPGTPMWQICSYDVPSYPWYAWGEHALRLTPDPFWCSLSFCTKAIRGAILIWIVETSRVESLFAFFFTYYMTLKIVFYPKAYLIQPSRYLLSRNSIVYGQGAIV